MPAAIAVECPVETARDVSISLSVKEHFELEMSPFNTLYVNCCAFIEVILTQHSTLQYCTVH